MVCVGIFLLVSGQVTAQSKPKFNDAQIDRIVAKLVPERTSNPNLKSYYDDQQTADLCEAWYSCAKWAFEQYVEDQSFRVTKALVKTEHRVYGRQASQEKHLSVKDTRQNQALNVLFFTPATNSKTLSYRYIRRVPVQ